MTISDKPLNKFAVIFMLPSFGKIVSKT